jgi:hypothetical protein
MPQIRSKTHGSRNANGSDMELSDIFTDWREQRALLISSMSTLAKAMGEKHSQEANKTNYLKMFMEQNPPIFLGSETPEYAEDWVFTIEKIFEAIDCPEERKVILATYILREEAKQWWRTTKGLIKGAMDWEGFLEIFMDRFFPEFERELKEKEIY